MSLESLPNEVLLKIIDILEEEGLSESNYVCATESLSTCSRHLYNVAIPSIYASIIVTNIERLRNFTKTVSMNPKLASLVSFIDLDSFDDDDYSASNGWKSATLNWTVDDVELSSSFLQTKRSDIQELLAEDRRSEILTQLETQDMSFWSLAALSICLLPNLKELNLPTLSTPQDGRKYDAPLFCRFIGRIARIQKNPGLQISPLSALNNLRIEGTYGRKGGRNFKSMIQLLTLPSLQKFVVRDLGVSENMSSAIYGTNSTLLHLSITNSELPARHLLDLLKSCTNLEQIEYEETGHVYISDSPVYSINIIEGLSHLKDRLRILSLLFGCHAQEPIDLSLLRDFKALQRLEISISTLLSNTKVTNSTFSGPLVGHIFPQTLVSLGLRCGWASQQYLDVMLQKMRQMVKEMKDSTPILEDITLSHFPEHNSHYCKTHSRCGIFKRHPLLLKLSTECQENGVTLKVS